MNINFEPLRFNRDSVKGKQMTTREQQNLDKSPEPSQPKKLTVPTAVGLRCDMFDDVPI